VIPGHEGGEVVAVGVCHGGDKILAGHGLAVVALEVEIQALAEAVPAHQGLDHADHFRALFIDRGGVEIVDFLIDPGPDGVGHGARVFRVLGRPQAPHFPDAGHRGIVPVKAEFLIPENGQAFLQRELEPVPAGDPVPGPVVAVLMGDDPVDIFKIPVRGHVRPGQHVFGVENVEALVFHGPHVEVPHGHDHVMVQVTFQAEAFFVPGHGLFQGRHGVIALV